MKILFLGDISGRAGRRALAVGLPKLQKKYKPDFTIANGENLAHGLGLTKKTFREMIDLGIDLLTGGNHILKKEDAKLLLKDEKAPLIRPLNYPEGTVGRGFFVLHLGIKRLLIVNLQGQAYFDDEIGNPYREIEKILEKYAIKKEAQQEGKERVDAILVDFHAETTSEKKILGWLLDGRVSAVLGTHTHVQTNDERILPKGTAYISDVGMVGVENSSLGVDFLAVAPAFLNGGPIRVEPSFGDPVEINGVLITVDKSSGLAKNIVKIREKVLKY